MDCMEDELYISRVLLESDWQYDFLLVVVVVSFSCSSFNEYILQSTTNITYHCWQKNIV